MRSYPHVHPASEFTTVGDIFSAETNKDRKKPFDIRTVMSAVVDQDHPVLERWAGMADADTSVVFDAHLGGIPVCVIGIESRVIPRKGVVPRRRPRPMDLRNPVPAIVEKTARTINAASGNRPLVVLANLSGFDGSPESLRNVQLEYGAEIGRAIVNFDGPIVFVVVSRYHGGAFVVFSEALNDNMEVARRRGILRLGHRRRPRRRRRVHPRRQRPHRSRPHHPTTRNPTRRHHRRRHQSRPPGQTRRHPRRRPLRQTRRGRRRIRSSPQRRTGPPGGIVHTIIPAAELRPRIITALEHGITRTLDTLNH